MSIGANHWIEFLCRSVHIKNPIFSSFCRDCTTSYKRKLLFIMISKWMFLMIIIKIHVNAYDEKKSNYALHIFFLIHFYTNAFYRIFYSHSQMDSFLIIVQSFQRMRGKKKRITVHFHKKNEKTLFPILQMENKKIFNFPHCLFEGAENWLRCPTLEIWNSLEIMSEVSGK